MEPLIPIVAGGPQREHSSMVFRSGLPSLEQEHDSGDDVGSTPSTVGLPILGLGERVFSCTANLKSSRLSLKLNLHEHQARYM